MNISLNWLSDYVDVSMPATELGDLLTRIGFTLEEIIESDADLVLDLEVTSNRPDALGHIGVAREIAAATGQPLRMPELPELPTAARVEELTSVQVDEPDLCPRYTARIIRGVSVGPSPAWLVERLEALGLRSVNNVVDVTNYVLLEYSQPLHSFDYGKLAEGRIVVRRARGGEQMTAIDGTGCTLDDSMLVIADARRPVAVAGIMGGQDTEVGEATTDILLEAAQFDPLVTRKTSRKLGLMSDSNYRFERGIDPVAIDEASRRACALIVELAGGTVAEGVVDVWARPHQRREVTLRPGRCTRVLGLDVPAERQVEILDRLGLSPRSDGEAITCTIPSYRADLTREADLIEEVARQVGYDQIPVHDRVAHRVIGEDRTHRVRRRISETLTAGGFDEAITFTFVDDVEAKLWGWDQPVRVDPLTRRTNNTLRPTLLPSLLRACKTNQDAGNPAVSLFELASAFPPAPAGGLTDEYVELGMVTGGELRDLRGAIEAVVEALAPSARLAVTPADRTGLADGQAARLSLDGRDIGWLGMISPEVQDHYGLEKPVAAAQVELAALVDRAELLRTFAPLAKFPPVRRDLSLIVGEEVTWQALAEAIEAVEQPDREEMSYVTTYRGKPLDKGSKSVTVTLTYRKDDRTLRGEEVDEMVSAVVAEAGKRLGATLRT